MDILEENEKNGKGGMAGGLYKEVPLRLSSRLPRQTRCLCAISFGLGMSLSCFCPIGLTLFFCAVILVALGISLLRHENGRQSG
mgnify:CR=1 FL=1